MTCEHLSDRMVEVLHGGDRWTAEEESHLSQCPDCAAEWRVLGLSYRTSDRAPRLDPGRVSERLRVRLVTEPREREKPQEFQFPRAVRWSLGLAAAATLVLALQRATVRPVAGVPPAPSAEAKVLPELDDLSPRELERVIRAVGGTGEVGVPGAEPAFGELTPEELERVLHSMET